MRIHVKAVAPTCRRGKPLHHRPARRSIAAMKEPSALLLLSGSAEAQMLRPELVKLSLRLRCLASEKPRKAVQSELATDYRRFDDAQGMREYLEQRGIAAILDAGHGFDGIQSAQAHAAAGVVGLPCISLRRRAWETEGRDNWHRVPDVAAAMPMIPLGARVFSATGWASLPDYAGFPGAKLLLRQTREHRRPPPFDFVEPVFGCPPYPVEEEVALFQRLGVQVLMCRNLGGEASRTKLDAAARLDLDVILIDRPSLPKGAKTVETVAEALAWAKAL